MHFVRVFSPLQAAYSNFILTWIRILSCPIIFEMTMTVPPSILKLYFNHRHANFSHCHCERCVCTYKQVHTYTHLPTRLISKLSVTCNTWNFCQYNMPHRLMRAQLIELKRISHIFGQQHFILVGSWIGSFSFILDSSVKLFWIQK